jgi:hypothetical protein
VFASPFANSLACRYWTEPVRSWPLGSCSWSRLGLFALAVAIATFMFLTEVPLTGEMSTWYADQTIFAGVVIGVLALAAAHFARARMVQTG